MIAARLVVAIALVAGCRRPVDRQPLEATAGAARAPDSAPADARVPADAGRDAFAMTDEEMRAYCRRPDVYCHPAHKQPPPDAAPALEGRVVTWRTAERPTAQRQTLVVVEIGQQDGVVATWRGELYRGARRVGTFVIDTVEASTTTGYSDLRFDQLDRRVLVRFTP